MRRKNRRSDEHFLGKLTVPAHICMMQSIIEYTNQIGLLLSLNDTERSSIVKTVEMAFHSSVSDLSSPIKIYDYIHLEFVATKLQLVISIREKGIPFGRRKTDTRPIGEIVKNAPDAFTENQGMDKIEYLINGRDGRETRLTKSLRPGSLPEDLFKGDVTRMERKHTLKSEPVIRLTELSELQDVMRLAWKCYGYTQEALLYDINALKQKVESGELISIIAIDTTREAVIGHIGLKHHDNAVNVPEMGLAFVDPAYRKGGLAIALGKKAMEFARLNNYPGVFDCSVTTHTFSQQGMQAIGSRPCGVLFGIVAEGMQARQLETSNQEKGSVINHYYAFDRSQRTVYIPPRHQDMVFQIYKWLELPREFKAGDMKPASGLSNVSILPMPEEHNAAFIVVHTIGRKTKEEVKTALCEFKRKRADAVYVFLPLESCHLCWLVEQLEKEGFGFAGIMPHIHDGGDRLLMQYLSFQVNPSSIKLYGAMPQKLFNYILTEQGRVQR
ncbi:MAG: GNAT family N-acetyltransferase [Desulfobacter sp.]|nr:MAG: GNAT family N-acetyltransferase [Desulfobacter sp.]